MQTEKFFVAHDQSKLYGTLATPDSGEKFPAALFIGGSFPQTREGNLDNAHTEYFPKPLPERSLFRDEAQIFLQADYASFRYDKRGCGKSEGNFNSCGLFDFVEDAKCALQWLAQQPEIDPQRIGVVGQSEGALIAMILATECPEASFLIMQGGPYQNLSDILVWQAEDFKKSGPENIRIFREDVPLMYWLYQQYPEILSSVEKKEQTLTIGDENWSFELYLPWLIEHFANPAHQYLDKVKCPVLILQGELDHNVPAEDADKLAQGIRESGNDKVTCHIFPGLEHSFRRIGDPNEDFVTAMKRPLDPVMPEAVTKWLQSLN